jgi:hypothetical protein
VFFEMSKSRRVISIRLILHAFARVDIPPRFHNAKSYSARGNGRNASVGRPAFFGGRIMDRRRSIFAMLASAGNCAFFLGCRGTDVGVVKKDSDKDLVGNTAAGAETYKPQIEEALCKLLDRQNQASSGAVLGSNIPLPGPKRICFVGLENKSSEDLGDFKALIEQVIEQRLNRIPEFEQVSKRYTETAMRETRLRMDELVVPAKQRMFLASMEQQGMKFDYLLFATVSSGTTRGAGESQKDYLMSLELLEISTGKSQIESASVRKGYHKTHGLR